jgi:hypothetical protein
MAASKINETAKMAVSRFLSIELVQPPPMFFETID